MFGANILGVQAEVEMFAYINECLIHDCASGSIKRHGRVFHTSRVGRGKRGVGGGNGCSVAIVAVVDPSAFIAAEAGSVSVNRDEVGDGGHGGIVTVSRILNK